MNNRQGMRVRALGMLDSQIGAWAKAERKRIKRIYRMIPPRPLNEDEANKLIMEIFDCNADGIGKLMKVFAAKAADLVKGAADQLCEKLI